MKRSLLITLAVLVAAGNAFAVGGNVGLFTSPTALSCAIVQNVSITTIAVVHKNHTGTTAVAFAAPLPACGQAGLVWIADQNPQAFVIIPNDTLGSQGGISVGYGNCQTGPVHVINMLFNRTVIFPPGSCCLYTVKPNLVLSPNVISADCAGNPVEEIANGTSANLRPTGAAVTLCPCNIPNEASTWGVIKELFRQGS